MRKTAAMAAAGLLLAPGTPGALAAGGGAGLADGLHLVPMDEIRVPIVEGNRADGALQLKLVLVVADAAAVEESIAALPTLRATSLAAALEFARLYASPMMPVDAEKLAADMTLALHAQDPRIDRVLVVEVAAWRA